MPFERIANVLEAAQAVATYLRRRRTRTYEFSYRLEQDEPPPQLRGDELRLIETSQT